MRTRSRSGGLVGAVRARARSGGLVALVARAPEPGARREVFVGRCAVVVAVALAACGGGEAAAPARSPDPVALAATLPRAPGAFGPSLVAVAPAPPRAPDQVSDGTLLADVDGCAACHPDAAAQWSASAHSFASFGNPIYRFNVEQVRGELGKTASRHCGGCHDMPLMVDGLMTADEPIPAADLRAHSGVTCRLCHGVESTTRDGNGSYVWRPTPIEVPAPGDAASLARHKRQVTAKLDTELCVGCHRGFLSPDMAMPVHLTGIDEPTFWRSSAWTGNGMARIDKVEKRTCLDCHMEREPASAAELGAKRGTIASHRFVGGHTWMAAMRGDADHLARTRAKLAGAASIDIAAARVGGAPYVSPDSAPVAGRRADPAGSPHVSADRTPVADAAGSPHVSADRTPVAGPRPDAAGSPHVSADRTPVADTAGSPRLSGDRAASVSQTAPRGRWYLPADGAPVVAGARLELDVVIRNLLVGHRFPGGVLDIQDTWIELEVVDATGTRIASSGQSHALRAGDDDTHVLRTLVVDAEGRVLEEHQMARFRTQAPTQTLAAREAQAVRYALAVPAHARQPLTVTARLRHRSRSLDMQAAVCRASKTPEGQAFLAGARGARSVALDPCRPQPITEIAEARVELGDGARIASTRPAWERHYEHGMALVATVAERLGEARAALEAALAAAPDARARAMVTIQLAWVAAKESRADEALVLIADTRRLLASAAAPARAAPDQRPPSPAVLDAVAVDALTRVSRWAEAVAPARACTERAPQNATAWSNYARVLVATGDFAGALAAAGQGLALAPRDPDLLRSQATAAGALQRPDAPAALAAYDRFRPPDEAAKLRILCATGSKRCWRERKPVQAIELAASR